MPRPAPPRIPPLSNRSRPAAAAPPAPSPTQAIAAALEAFLGRGRVAAVHFAASSTEPPPALAYLVPFPRLSLTLAGTEPVQLGLEGRGGTLRLRSGDVLVVPPHCWNRPAQGERASSLNVLFGHRQVGLSLVGAGRGRRSRAGAQEVLKAVLPAGRDEAPRAVLQALMALRTGALEAQRLLVGALLHALLEALLAPETKPKRRAAGLYESMCMHVQERFSHPLNRKSVAAHFRVSPGHVSRLFKREGLVRFNDYINYVRINHAKLLLSRHGQSLDEVAASCGYSDTNYFCRVFKRKVRLSPGAWRAARRDG